MTGMDCYNVLNGSSFRFDREAATKDVIALTERLKEQGSLKGKKPRILLTGSPIGGVYPLGEGAGYAGGIVSAAVDGLCAGMTCDAQE